MLAEPLEIVGECLMGRPELLLVAGKEARKGLPDLLGLDRSEVRLRTLGSDGRETAREVLVSRGCPDAYDAVAAVDGDGRTWVAYTGLAESGRYDVFVRTVDGGEVSPPPSASVESRGRTRLLAASMAGEPAASRKS